MRVIKIVFIFIAIALLPFVFALLQLNSLALFVNGDPKIIGIVKDKDKIVSSLKANDMVPRIVVSTPQRMVYSLATAMSGEENFYGKYVLTSIPESFILSKNVDVGMLMMDDTLIISKLKSSDLQATSPIIAHLFVQEYFQDRRIKSYPKVTILEKQAYSQYRTDQYDKKFRDVDKEIKMINDKQVIIYADIAKDRDMMNQNQTVISKAQMLNDTKYKKCCSAMRRKLDKEIVQGKKNISDWHIKLENDQKRANDYEYYIHFYEKQKSLMEIRKGNIPYELGVFEAEDVIKVVLAQQGDTPESGIVTELNDETLLINYMNTLIHEYLHYASYVAKDPPTLKASSYVHTDYGGTQAARQARTLHSDFFEEGLTEYFARKIMEKHFGRSSTLAYPVQTKIMTEMTKKIPEKELADIYFSKDAKKLEEILNKTYGKDFYKTNELLFQTLQYTSDPDHLLKITNDIMKQIGGEPIEGFSNP